MYCAHIQTKHEVEYGSAYGLDRGELYGFLSDLQVPIWTGGEYADEYSNEWEIPRCALEAIKPWRYRRIEDAGRRRTIRKFIRDCLKAQTGDNIYISFF